MGHKVVADVMTRDVVTVGTNTPFREVVRTLTERGIDGAPVLDANGRVVGIVTEADLLGKQAQAGRAGSTSMRHLWLRRAFSRMSSARTAADLMSRPVVTVQTRARLPVAAATLARYNIKAAPVVDADGALQGIVSRKDLLSVYLRADTDLAAEIRSGVLSHAMSVRPSDVTVEVCEGVVTLRGKVERLSMVDIITDLTAAVDGVVDVRNELTADTDDIRVQPSPPENVARVDYLGGNS